MQLASSSSSSKRRIKPLTCSNAVPNANLSEMKLQFKYPYEEFEEHGNALEQVLGWEHTRIFGELGSRSDFAANQARILEYFSDCYKSREESAQKSECFRQILEYTQQHRKFFERAGLYMQGAKIDDALMRSIHFVFTSAQIPIESSKVHPKLV